MPCKKYCCKVKSQDKCGCKFDCESILKKPTTTLPTDPMMDYGATVTSNAYRALIPYNHLSHHASVLLSPSTTPPTSTENISLGILVSMLQITLRRLLIHVSHPPNVPVTFRVYRRIINRDSSGQLFGELIPTALFAVLLDGTIMASGEEPVFSRSQDQILVLVEPTDVPQNLGYVTASIAYEEQQF